MFENITNQALSSPQLTTKKEITERIAQCTEKGRLVLPSKDGNCIFLTNDENLQNEIGLGFLDTVVSDNGEKLTVLGTENGRLYLYSETTFEIRYQLLKFYSQTPLKKIEQEEVPPNLAKKITNYLVIKENICRENINIDKHLEVFGALLHYSEYKNLLIERRDLDRFVAQLLEITKTTEKAKLKDFILSNFQVEKTWINFSFLLFEHAEQLSLNKFLDEIDFNLEEKAQLISTGLHHRSSANMWVRDSLIAICKEGKQAVSSLRDKMNSTNEDAFRSFLAEYAILLPWNETMTEVFSPSEIATLLTKQNAILKPERAPLVTTLLSDHKACEILREKYRSLDALSTAYDFQIALLSSPHGTAQEKKNATAALLNCCWENKSLETFKLFNNAAPQLLQDELTAPKNMARAIAVLNDSKFAEALGKEGMKALFAAHNQSPQFLESLQLEFVLTYLLALDNTEKIIFLKFWKKRIDNATRENPIFREIILEILQCPNAKKELLETFITVNSLLFALETTPLVQPTPKFEEQQQAFCKQLLLEKDRYLLDQKSRFEILTFLLHQDPGLSKSLLHEEHGLKLTPIERLHLIYIYLNKTKPHILSELKQNQIFQTRLLPDLLNDPVTTAKLFSSTLVEMPLQILSEDQIRSTFYSYLSPPKTQEKPLSEKNVFLRKLKIPFFNPKNPVAEILREVDYKSYQKLLYEAALRDPKIAQEALRRHILYCRQKDYLMQLKNKKEVIEKTNKPTEQQVLRYSSLVIEINKQQQKLDKLEEFSSEQVATILSWHGKDFWSVLSADQLTRCLRFINEDNHDTQKQHAIERLKGYPGILTRVGTSSRISILGKKSIEKAVVEALETYQDKPLTYAKLRQTLELWRSWHSSLSTLFSPGRWFKPEGMPETMIQLKQLINNLPKNVDPNQEVSTSILTTLLMIIDDRNQRNSKSTQDPQSHTSRLVQALKSTSTLTAVTPKLADPPSLVAVLEHSLQTARDYLKCMNLPLTKEKLANIMGNKLYLDLPCTMAFNQLTEKYPNLVIPEHISKAKSPNLQIVKWYIELQGYNTHGPAAIRGPRNIRT